jgi:ABC-2 type transport system permease protein
MNRDWTLPKAILRRELVGYFSNPTGYVFISLFVFLSAITAFWRNEFFVNNLANLDPLNEYIPYLLMLFIPAITMSAWADEKRNGTDELLLTLPASDTDIVLGKYGAMLAIYSVSLAFSLSHVIVLLILGSPDFGLILSTYLGYWLIGAAMLSLGMLGSLLTANLTVAFIAGALLCAAPVFIEYASVLVGGGLERLIQSLSFVEQLRDFTSGLVPISGVLYFVGFTAAILYLNVALLGRRHWPTGEKAPRLGRHFALRTLALVVAAASVTIVASRLGGRIDVTSEQIHSLSASTRELLQNLDPDKPVFIQAYVSPNVPRGYLQTRNNIVSLLRQFDSLGGDRVHARVITTGKYTDEAREAQDRYNIQPQPMSPFETTGSGSPSEIFLGVAVSHGSQEEVIPFFPPGLSVEYELMRSVRVVVEADRKKVGVLSPQIEMFGGFDFATRQRSTPWSIVPELQKQYEVVPVQSGEDYPTDLDVLMVVLPHLMPQADVQRLASYVGAGNPVLIFVDPLPSFDMAKAPQQAPQSPFSQGPPPAAPADITPVLDLLGVEWPTDDIAWDRYNPHPQFRALPEEVVFVSAQPEQAGFNADNSVSSGLQEVVAMYPGVLLAREGSNTTFSPLLQTGVDSSTSLWFRLVQNSLFGPQITQGLPHESDEARYTIAARVQGEGDGAPNGIVIADVDLMGEQFFQLRAQGVENLEFDNVTFLLNAVDQLASDESFIALRKRRRRHRTLETVEAMTKTYEDARIEDTREAEAGAEEQLEAAQTRLNDAVADLESRDDLDLQTKRIMIANQQQIENRRLTVAQRNIEDGKQRRIERSRADMEASVRGIQNTIKIAAVALAPVPAFLLFIAMSLRRKRREEASLSRDRMVEA